ncbi:DoxX family protein [Aliagarivorans taiwanensis]|uniref:DoxX family protein n=1 Tax=Aliagarivorans taiwanensis TaxID=561966 RepID=UPI00041CDA46|nr:DoxX family protein [Aliagarivorans taiwanensis]
MNASIRRLFAANTSWSVDLLIRLMLGAIFVFHGWGKVTGIEGTIGFFQKIGLEPATLLAYLAAYGEVIGGILIAAGLATRLAALNCAVIMLVAIVNVHLGQGFKGMEFQLLILVASLQLLITGAGRWSLDALVFGKRSA